MGWWAFCHAYHYSGQADWVIKGGTGTFKDVVPSGTRYTANNGAAFAEAILRTVFGYQPSVGSGNPELWETHSARGIQARLESLQLPNGTLVSICATASGVAYC
jgi:hypothetical protein